ncbi:hypothetical protein LJC11_03985 [Bacteroidales bacterium OttesenSCG-928-I21]|nr:hypothetical protein [Bacteroidales bacterium OttesenSCG-928-I21]
MYIWGGQGEKAGGWPGTEMTRIGESGTTTAWYYYTFNSNGNNISFKFNNGSGTQSNEFTNQNGNTSLYNFTQTNNTNNVSSNLSPETTAIDISDECLFVEQGGTLQLKASVTPSNAIPIIKWNVSSGASITSNGVLSTGSLPAGSTIVVTATSVNPTSVFANCTIKVVQSSIPKIRFKKPTGWSSSDPHIHLWYSSSGTTITSSPQPMSGPDDDGFYYYLLNETIINNQANVLFKFNKTSSWSVCELTNTNLSEGLCWDGTNTACGSKPENIDCPCPDLTSTLPDPEFTTITYSYENNSGTYTYKATLNWNPLSSSYSSYAAGYEIQAYLQDKTTPVVDSPITVSGINSNSTTVTLPNVDTSYYYTIKAIAASSSYNNSPGEEWSNEVKYVPTIVGINNCSNLFIAANTTLQLSASVTQGSAASNAVTWSAIRKYTESETVWSGNITSTGNLSAGNAEVGDSIKVTVTSADGTGVAFCTFVVTEPITLTFIVTVPQFTENDVYIRGEELLTGEPGGWGNGIKMMPYGSSGYGLDKYIVTVQPKVTLYEGLQYKYYYAHSSNSYEVLSGYRTVSSIENVDAVKCWINNFNCGQIDGVHFDCPDGNEITLREGETYQFIHVNAYTNGIGGNKESVNWHAVWESSDENIATVDHNNLLTAHGCGVVNITARPAANPTAASKTCSSITIKKKLSTPILEEPTYSVVSANNTYTGTLTWEEVADATLYKIINCSTNLEVGTTTSTTYDLPGLTTGSAHTYQVQAVNTNSCMLDSDLSICESFYVETPSIECISMIPTKEEEDKNKIVYDSNTVENIWESATIHYFNKVIYGSVNSENLPVGQWRTIYQNGNLYFLIEVYDDDKTNKIDPDAVRKYGDGVEIYIQGSYNARQIGIAYNPGNQSDFQPTEGAHKNGTFTVHNAVQGIHGYSNGYIVKGYISGGDIGENFGNGSSLTLEVIVNQSSGTGTVLDAKVATWATAETYQNSKDFGGIKAFTLTDGDCEDIGGGDDDDDEIEDNFDCTGEFVTMFLESFDMDKLAVEGTEEDCPRAPMMTDPYTGKLRIKNLDYMSPTTIAPGKKAGFVNDGYYAILTNPGFYCFGHNEKDNNEKERWFLYDFDHTGRNEDGTRVNAGEDENNGMLLANNNKKNEILYSHIIPSPQKNIKMMFSAWYAFAAPYGKSAELTFRVYVPKSDNIFPDIENIENILEAQQSLFNTESNWVSLKRITTGEIEEPGKETDAENREAVFEWLRSVIAFNSGEHKYFKVTIENHKDPGTGNDVVIDDIGFYACVPPVDLELISKGNKCVIIGDQLESENKPGVITLSTPITKSILNSFGSADNAKVVFVIEKPNGDFVFSLNEELTISEADDDFENQCDTVRYEFTDLTEVGVYEFRVFIVAGDAGAEMIRDYFDKNKNLSPALNGLERGNGLFFAASNIETVTIIPGAAINQNTIICSGESVRLYKPKFDDGGEESSFIETLEMTYVWKELESESYQTKIGGVSSGSSEYPFTNALTNLNYVEAADAIFTVTPIIRIGGGEGIECPGEDFEVTVTVLPPKIEWLGGEDGDWNNPDNWSAKHPPLPCTDVYIPGDNRIEGEVREYYFPSLLGERDNEGNILYNEDIVKYTCNNIYFLHGAQLGRPDLLTYDRAHVQLNFGCDGQETTNNNIVCAYENEVHGHLSYCNAKSGGKLARAQWHMLSAPLHSMVSGDFAMGGFPLTYMRKFNVKKGTTGLPTGDWTTNYTTLVEPLNAGEGFIFWMNPYIAGYPNFMDENTDGYPHASGKSCAYGVKHMNGILHFPHHENELLSQYRRVHTINGDVSTFHYIQKNTLQLTGDKDTHNRNGKLAYRFIAEQSDGKGGFAFQPVKYTAENQNANEEILIGNPYMASINFVKFFIANKKNIKGYFRIMNENNTFDAYAIAPDGTIITTEDVGEHDIATTTAQTGYIPPMQSFIVGAKKEKAEVTFEIDHTTVQPEQKLKAKSANRSILWIETRNKNYKSRALIGKYDNVSDNYVEDEDVPKLFSTNKAAPNVYTKSNETAIEMNFVSSNNDLVIPVEIYTTSKTDITFTLTGMDTYDAEKIEFIDAVSDNVFDITGQESFEYTFNNETSGVIENRFFVRFGTADFGGGDDDGNIVTDITKIYWTDNSICGISSADNPIKEISVYNTKGQLLYRKDNIQSSFYHIDINKNMIPRQVYIVKLITEKGSKSVKIIN